MSVSPILAVILSLGMILGGNALEGGHLSSLSQPTAAMIVLGGTAGATWLGSTDEEVKLLLKSLPRLIRPGLPDRAKALEHLLKVANVVRRDGILAVEGMLGDIEDEFLKRGLRVMVDGYGVDDLRRLLELDIELTEHHGGAVAKVLESAGGFAPTVGILGAVLGLIHVMQNLSDPSKLGTGIAVAFVATIYGVGVANLFLIPMGNRLKKIIQQEVEAKTMILTGLEVIAAGSNPRQVGELLSAYVGHGGSHGADDAHGGDAKAAA